MRFDLFIKNLTKLEIEISGFLAMVNLDQKFDFNARTSPQFNSEVNQQRAITDATERIEVLHEGLSSLLDKIKSGEIGFNNTYDRSKWSEAIHAQERKIAEIEKTKLNLTNESEELTYLKELNHPKLKIRLIALEGDMKGKFVWVNQNDDMIFEEPKGWNWGVVVKGKYLNNIYTE